MTEQWIPTHLKRGQLHKDLGIPWHKKIPRALLEQAAKRKDKVGQRARFALTMRGINDNRS